MIDDYSRDLLRTGILNAKTGDRTTARRYLDRAIYMASDHEALAEAWFWMSQITDDPAEKHKALENCLAHDLRHTRARRELAVLEGRIKPEEIIDPNAPVAAPAPAADADAQRFVCPKCGGRMSYSPDGGSLVCEYCTRRDRVAPGEYPIQERPTADRDFLVTMATARGHRKPLQEQVFHCQGCSAQFILPPGQLSITCPYCESPHVVCLDKSPDLLAPDGIIPHAFDQAHASRLLAEWVNPLSHISGLPVPRALYLPLWTFDMGGAVDYVAEVVQDQEVEYGRHSVQKVRTDGTYPVALRDLPIPASRKLSAPFVRLLRTFDLKDIQPYDPRYLADWPAELYDIPMGDASLDARSQALGLVKREMAIRLSPAHIISVSSAGMMVESFRLNLLPVWMAEVPSRGNSSLVLINGQRGDVEGDLGDKPRKQPGGLMEWLSDLIGE